MCKLARLLDEQGKAQLAGEARTRARALLERQLAAEHDNEAPASALADLLLVDLPPSDTTAWTTLKLIGMKSEGGATLALQNDGSILASGKNPDHEVYTLVARPGLEHISAIRLEALPDPSLPSNGPGRCPGCSNFHLNEMRVFSGSQRSTLTDIFVADNEAHDFRDVIDGKIDEMPGWGTYRTRGEKHAAIVATDLKRPRMTT